MIVSWHPNAIIDGALILTQFPRQDRLWRSSRSFQVAVLRNRPAAIGNRTDLPAAGRIARLTAQRQQHPELGCLGPRGGGRCVRCLVPGRGESRRAVPAGAQDRCRKVVLSRDRVDAGEWRAAGHHSRGAPLRQKGCLWLERTGGFPPSAQARSRAYQISCCGRLFRGGRGQSIVASPTKSNECFTRSSMPLRVGSSITCCIGVAS